MSSAGSKQEDRASGGFEVLGPGMLFARYEIVRCVGVGGMGAVFEATHVLLKKRVALKTMHTNLVRSEASRARFLREAETVARIRHPNVVDVSDVGIEHGVPFLVMEFLDGEDLLHLITRDGPLDARVAIDAVLPIAAGLCAVHRLGIVHRDVKPENILLALGPSGSITPKLIDFGVSKDLDASVRAGGLVPHTVTGTPHYMSPEQARGAAQLDGRTDQYALGVLLYQCLSGRLPYESPSLLELIHLIDCGQYKPLAELRPGLPAGLEDVVHRAMGRHPRDRFANMEAFGRALLPFASERVAITLERDFLPSASPNGVTLDAMTPFPFAGSPTPMGDPFGVEPNAKTRSQTESFVRKREEAAETERDAVPQAAPDPMRKLAWLVGAFVALSLAFASLAFVLLSRHEQEEIAGAVRAAATFRLTLAVHPSDATIELDGEAVGRGKVDRELPRDGREHFLRLSAEGYEPRSIVFRDQPPDQAYVALDRIAPEVTPALVPAAPEVPPRKKLETKKPREPRSEPVDIQLSR